MGRVELMELLIQLFNDAKAEVANFGRKTYDEKIDMLYAKHVSTLEEVEKLYHAEQDNEQVLTDLAKAFPECVYAQLEGFSKRKKSNAMLDYNMSMVTYVMPIIGKRKDECMALFVEKCVEEWNVQFPGFKIQVSTLQDIKGGFRTGLCYITTAVCESFNRADNCYELEVLRNYRDGYLLSETEDGDALIRRYYDIAPTIVKHINKSSDSQLIYQNIWNEYLNPCIQLIEEGNQSECKNLYTEMVEDLALKYFH